MAKPKKKASKKKKPRRLRTQRARARPRLEEARQEEQARVRRRPRRPPKKPPRKPSRRLQGTSRKSCQENRRRNPPRRSREAKLRRTQPPKKAASRNRSRAGETGTTPQQPKSRKPKRLSAPAAAAKPARAARPPAARATTPIYITTAIAYPNGVPHIGHAYEAIATDALARFQRLDGKDVFFLTGTDEHGLKMIQTAQAEGMTPLDLATRNAAPLQGDGPAAQRLVRPLHPHLRAAASSLGPGDLEADGSTTATSISTAMPAGIRCATKPITPRTKPSSARTRCGAARRARRSSGSRRRAISSSCRPIRTGCSRSTRTSPISSGRTRAATK